MGTTHLGPSKETGEIEIYIEKEGERERKRGREKRRERRGKRRKGGGKKSQAQFCKN